MLLPMRLGLRQNAIFVGLSALVKEVIRAGCAGRSVDEVAMPDGLWHAVQANVSTTEAIASLNLEIGRLNGEEKYALWYTVSNVPSIPQLMCDSTTVIPTPPAGVQEALKKCVVHLIGRTSELVDVKKACRDSLIDYYNRYSSNTAPGNGKVCGMCGTDVLAQQRHGVADQDQWRAAFDHLLAEALYPLLALEPANLLPVCHSCNSKAKLAKDILHDRNGNRRRSFDPWSESAQGQLRLTVDLPALGPSVDLVFQPAGAHAAEKLQTWDQVYAIRQRVLGEFSSLEVKLTEDLSLNTLEEFKASVEAKAVTRKAFSRISAFNHWRGLLYEGMLQMPDTQLDQLRELCNAVAQEYSQDVDATFGDLL